MSARYRREAERLADDFITAIGNSSDPSRELRTIIVGLALASFARLTGRRPRTLAERSTKAARVGKRQSKRQRTSEIRELVMARANLVCECGCRRWFRGFTGAAQLDHFEGRARSESIETCWALRADCHQQKTLNFPDSAYWLRCFIRHCERHGYSAEAAKARSRLEGIVHVRQAEGGR